MLVACWGVGGLVGLVTGWWLVGGWVFSNGDFCAIIVCRFGPVAQLALVMTARASGAQTVSYAIASKL